MINYILYFIGLFFIVLAFVPMAIFALCDSHKQTGGSFRETYEDNEPQNPDELERYLMVCRNREGGEPDD